MNRSSSWSASFRTASLRAAAVCLILSPITLLGCSGSEGRVSGKVTYNGQAVTGGTVIFAPLGTGTDANAGVPASGAVKPDGTFVLGTQGAATGAVIGRNRITYAQPPTPPGGTAGAPVAAPYAGLVPKQQEVEVKAGSNTFDIELALPGVK
jgi:hypothetical protein